MRVLTSTPTRDGHLLVVRLDQAAQVVLQDADGTVCELTDWVADLLLLGMLDRAERARGEQLEVTDTIEVARVALTADPDSPAPTFTYVHLPSGDSEDLTVDAALALIGRGVQVQIVAGVAADSAAAAPVPDTAADLTD